jgi:hypothetical protein
VADCRTRRPEGATEAPENAGAPAAADADATESFGPPETADRPNEPAVGCSGSTGDGSGEEEKDRTTPSRSLGSEPVDVMDDEHDDPRFSFCL